MTRYTARELRALDTLADFESTREAALEADCPQCAQPAGEPCVNTDFPEQLLRAPAHWQRITAARRRPQPTDPATED